MRLTPPIAIQALSAMKDHPLPVKEPSGFFRIRSAIMVSCYESVHGPGTPGDHCLLAALLLRASSCLAETSKEKIHR